MKKFIIAIDQGTSGTKAIIFDRDGKMITEGRTALQSYYPAEGIVEQDPEEIYVSVIKAVQICIENFISKGHNTSELISCGISNQRETFILWDRNGHPLAPAVVWQCKRSIPVCHRLIENGHTQFIRDKTGLFIDPYFSGTKVIQLAEENHAIRKAIDSGDAYFGTVDTWLLYRLTNGKSYKTDYTNASRTILFNLKNLKWDSDLLNLFDLNGLKLPAAISSSSDFGKSNFNGILNRPLPITAMIGDSHAAAFGERCFEPGSAKATMGTGSSVLLNSGTLIEPADTTMVSTICWSTDDTVSYALEGIIVSCGSTLAWLKDSLGLFSDSAEASKIAEKTDNSGNVILIPAFSGLGAPWWKMSEQASIRGITFETTKQQIIRAGFESIIFQVTDVIKAMEFDMKQAIKTIQIDGGVTDSKFIMNSIAGLSKAEIIKCELREASALGAAFLAGLKSGVWDSIEQLKKIKYEDGLIARTNFDSGLIDKHKQWLKIIEGLD